MLGSVDMVWFRCDLDGMTEIDGETVDNREREKNLNCCSCRGASLYEYGHQRWYIVLSFFLAACTNKSENLELDVCLLAYVVKHAFVPGIGYIHWWAAYEEEYICMMCVYVWERGRERVGVCVCALAHMLVAQKMLIDRQGQDCKLH